MPKENRTIGLSVRETKLKLDELVAARQKVMDELAPYGTPTIDFPIKYIELSQKLNDINNQIIQVREWYNLGLSESLYHDLDD